MKDVLNPLPDSEEYFGILCEMATRINGFVYAGDRLGAVVDSIKFLRDNPDIADTLLNWGKGDK